MDFDQLRQLDAIAHLGTMSAAAEKLRMSQPALSRSMQRLETELASELFKRKGRRTTLSAAGKLAVEHARRILADEQLMRDALADHARRARALRVGAVAPAPLWRLTALLVERFPQTVLTSQTLPDREVERAVMDGAVDLGIALKPCILPAVRCCKLMTESLFVSLPPGHPLAGATSLAAPELDGETFLLYQGIGFWRGLCDRLFPRATFVEQEDRTVFDQMLRTTPLVYFVTDAPSFRGAAPEGRTVVPLRDTEAHATFYLLVRSDARPEALEAFEWASAAEKGL